jgi:hypothetical protein
MKIDWKDFEDKIKKIKYKHLLLLKFFNLLNFFDDNTGATIIRYIMKNQIDLFFDYPIFILCQYIPKERYPLTIKSILDFYDLVKEKIYMVSLVSKWYKVYKNTEFWNLEIEAQKKYLEELKQKILAIFDSTQGVMNIINRIGLIYKQDNNTSGIYQTNETLKERLHQLYILFGSHFFISVNIPIITNNDFDLMKVDEKIKYTQECYMKCLTVINQTLQIFEKLHLLNLRIDNLLNPYYVEIEDSAIDEDSVEDLSVIFEKIN